MTTGTEARVCEDIAKRQALGIKKYGTTVAQNPLELKQWLTHAYEEALDMAIYLKRSIEETEAPPRSFSKPEGTIEEQVFRKFPLLSSFDYCGLKMEVVEHRKSRAEITPTYVFQGIPRVESGLICRYNCDGKILTEIFGEKLFPYLLQCKSL